MAQVEPHQKRRREHASDQGMISVEKARAKILGRVRLLERVEVPLLESLGLVLAQDVAAPMDVPPFDNAAMDGFAVRATSVADATMESPRILRVTGQVAAGHSSSVTVEPGTAVRIMTGAPLPRGADAVVPFEFTNERELKAQATGVVTDIAVTRQVTKGDNVRRAGEDVSHGNLVLSAGTILRPPEIGVLASLGYDKAPVFRRPVVAILATGDEVVDVGQTLPPGKLYNSNTYTIAAQVMRCGGTPRVLGVAADKVEELTRAVRSGLEADLLITSGGVSAGDYDMVKDVLAAEGEIDFWTVRMKPGKPLAAGVFRSGGRQVPHIGLPGNPVSSMVAFEMFARPAILKMMGKKNLALPTIEARLLGSVKNTDGRRVFLRVKVSKEKDKFLARIAGPQGSGILSSMAQANGLAIVPEAVQEILPGNLVEVMMLNWNEEQCWGISK